MCGKNGAGVKLINVSARHGFESHPRIPINFFITGAWESTEHTVLTNLHREGREIINIKIKFVLSYFHSHSHSKEGGYNGWVIVA